MGGVVNAISEGVKHVGGQIGEGLKHLGGEASKIGLPVGGLLQQGGRMIAPEEEAAISKPGEDPKITELRRQQMQQAKDFRQNITSLQEKDFCKLSAR